MSIWKSQIFLEAEYHHVWSSSDGSEVIDITPKRDKEKYILFVIDPEQKDDGLPVCNKRQVLLDIPEVHKLKELFIKHTEIVYITPTGKKYHATKTCGAGEGPKGWAVRLLKRHASWVQNVVRQFGPYPLQALEY